jgi:hypothetical protein
MNRTSFRVWLSICWILTVGIAYMTGWYKGARTATTFAVDAAHSSFTFILAAMVIVALVAAVAAFKARGYFTTRPTA